MRNSSMRGNGGIKRNKEEGLKGNYKDGDRKKDECRTFTSYNEIGSENRRKIRNEGSK